MFYVKEPLKDGVDVTVEINDENVFLPLPGLWQGSTCQSEGCPVRQ